MPLFNPQLAYNWTAGDRLLLAENLQAAYCGGTILPTAGRVEGAVLRLPNAGVVTNLVINVTVAGSTLTANQCLAGLYDSGGTLIAATADQSGTWNSSGTKTMALASGPYTLQAGLYFAVFFANGSTLPTMARAGATSGSLANLGFPAPVSRFFFADTGRTTSLPATLGAQTASANAWYFALT